MDKFKLLSVAILFFCLFIVELSFGNTRSCRPDLSLAPSCPKNSGKILGDNYPAMAATVSTYNGVDFASSFVVKVSSQHKGNLPIAVSASQSDFNSLVNQIKNSNILTQKEKADTISNLRRIEPSGSPKDNWQQDYFETQFDPNTGMPILREIANYDDPNVKEKTRKGYLNDISKSFQGCGLAEGAPIKVDFDPSYGSGGTAGGNIEALPNGICTVGTDDFKTRDHYLNFSKNACGSENFLEAPTSFLEVGHVDEIMNVIPDQTKPPPCNYAIALASPRKAIELLEKTPNDPMFSKDYLNFKNDKAGLGATYRGICSGVKIMKKHLELKANDKNRYDTPGVSFLKFINSIFNSAIDQAIAQADYSIDRGEIFQGVKNDPVKQCETLTNKDFVNYIQEDEYDESFGSKPSELRMANNAIQAEMDEFKKAISKKTKSQVPSCDPEIIDVPYLFNASYDQKEKKAAHATSLFPNATNGVNINGTYIFSSPGNETFKKYNQDVYKRKGVKIDQIDTYLAHAREGNLHCSTNIIRYCNPR